MGEITITFHPYGRRAHAPSGATVLDSAREAGINIRSVCGGKGSCGKCKVIIKKGKVDFEHDPEKRPLTEEELSSGYVLACLARCETDCEVFVPFESRIEGQKILSKAEIPEIRPEPAVELRPPPLPSFGLALDIGTTKLTAYLVDLATGKILGAESDYNRQLAYGEDLVSRIGYTVDREGGTKNMQRAVITVANDLIEKLCSARSADAGAIIDVCAAGNTVMTHFFIGKDASPLLHPDAQVQRDPVLMKASSLGLRVNPEAKVYCLPCVSRFLGGDVVGDVLLSRMFESDEISLLLDIGTNVEAVLGSKGWLLSTTAAAGPAFEGWGIRFGMRSVEGAIDRLRIDPSTLRASYSVIGETKPRGICGSGLIDLMAEMFRNGILDRLGKMNRKLDSPWLRAGDDGYEYVVVPARETDLGRDIVITENDVMNLIDSKAAACSTIGVMMKKMDLSVNDITKVYICGAFACYLDLNSSVEIGLLPEFPNAETKFLGNGAVGGSYLALVSRDRRREAGEIVKLMTYFDLLKDADFMDEYTAAYMLPGKRELFPTWWAKRGEDSSREPPG